MLNKLPKVLLTAAIAVGLTGTGFAPLASAGYHDKTHSSKRTAKRDKTPKDDFKRAGDHYEDAGSETAKGAKRAGDKVEDGRVGRGAVELGKGVGRAGKSVGKGTVDGAKGVKDAVDPRK